MNTRLLARVVCMLAALAGAGAVHAQPPGETSLDVTIRLLPENAVGPEEITRRIELPPAAEAARPPQAEAGPPPAGEGPGRGDEISSEARARGREFGQEVAEQARENRETAGRPDSAGRPDDVGRPDDAGPPESPPDRPGPPDSPGPPSTPPGRP